MNQPRKMFKVISPVEKQGGGGQWWMRCGTAYLNKDESINVYIDSLPLANLAKNDGLKFQIREYTEAELRERAEKKSGYSSRASGLEGMPTLGGGAPSPHVFGAPGGRGPDRFEQGSVNEL